MALTISRKAGQAVELQIPGRAEPVVVRVTGMRRGQAKLRFECSPDVEVIREELRATWVHRVRLVCP